MQDSLKKTKVKYDAIDGLRAFSAIGILLMHFRAKGVYTIPGFVHNSIIPSFADLVFLFMTVSAFGMCCGYFEGIAQGKIDIDRFYKRRFSKTLPYFAVLCVLDILLSPSVNALRELFANLTLCFGLLPNCGDISVIGVGWFLGIIFVFYMIFPFFCFLIRSKRRAWLTFAVSLAFNIFCADYFKIGRTNILYCMVFFVAGGLVYLYRETLCIFARRFKPLLFLLCIGFAALYYTVGAYVPILVALFALMLIYAIAAPKDGKENRPTVLNNPVTRFLSGISMEMYLCHMVVFGGFEKLRLIRPFASECANYIFICIVAFAGTVLFAVTAQTALRKAGEWIRKKRAD